MSFPGYLKSLELKSNHLEETGPRKKAEDTTKVVGGRNDKVHRGDSEGAAAASHNGITSSSQDVRLIDDKGNTPTTSLWVGNIPPRATDPALRALFSRFGSIVSTKISSKYAFVNFETIDSAIGAFNEYHDQDIFLTGNSRVYIRFAAPRIEAKQVKERVKVRRSSMTAKAESAQRQWFEPVERVGTAFVVDPDDATNWPNGKPPTGPKSQKREVSPPPSRRNDPYWSLDSSRRETYRTEPAPEARWSESAASYKHPSSYSSYRGRAAGFRSRSASLSSSSSRFRSISPDLLVDRRGTDSPLPWERHSVRKQGDETAVTEPQNMSASNDSNVASKNSVNMSGDNGGGCSPTLAVRAVDAQILDSAVVVRGSSEVPDSPRLAVNGVPNEYMPFHESKKTVKSSPLEVIERAFRTDDDVRCASVASDVATSSTKTSVRKRRCGDCKKTGSEISPLIPCSTCTRKFHSGCGEPRPSASSDKSAFVCGRCLWEPKLGRLDPVDITPQAAGNTALHNHINRHDKPHLIQPSPTHDQENVADKNHPSVEGPSHGVPNASNLKSLFQIDDDTTTPILKSSVDSVKQGKPVVTRLDRQINVQSTDRSAGPTLRAAIIAQRENESPEQKARKYKRVTCKWWASGNCTQAEDKCYYAHSHTNISLPSGKRFNKDWTCFDWLQGTCRKQSQDCWYAHENTGLQIWLDGQPSFKHVTCYWWIRSYCKFSDEMCKFAHKDTGLYGLDPSEKWHGGAKFTTIHPASASVWADRPPLRPSFSDQQPFPRLSDAGNLVWKKSSVDTVNDDPGRPDHSNTSPTSSSEVIDSEQSAGQHPNPSVSLVKANTVERRVGLVVSEIAKPSARRASSGRADAAVHDVDMCGSVNSVSPAQKSLDELMQALRKHKSLQPRSHSDVTDENSLLSHGKGAHAGAPVAHSDVNVTMHVDTIDSANRMQSTTESSSWKHGLGSHVSDSLHNNVRLEQSSRDPRLARRDQADATLDSLIPQKSNSLNSGAEHITRLRTDVDTCVNKEGVTNDELSRKLKRCKICHKTVFGTEFCRGCSNSNPGQAPNATVDASVRVDEAPQVDLQARHQVVNVTDVLVEDLGHDNRESSVRPVVRNPLKRNASSTSMFLKNKRPKSSMLFSSGGRPYVSAMGKKADNQTLPTSRKPGDGNGQARQSLEDLIRQERTKNKSQPVQPSIEQPAHDHYTNDKGVEHEIPDSTDEPMSSCEPSPVEDRRRRWLADDEEDLDWPNVHSPTPEPVEPSKSSEVVRDVPPGEAARLINEFFTTSRCKALEDMQRASHRQSRSAAAESTATKTRAPKSGSEISRRSTESSAGTGEPQWVSSITCTVCRKKHKKCVHSMDGSLCAQKCREYVLSRRGKRDTGRPNYEWQAILAAAELDADPDEDEDEVLEGPEEQSSLQDDDSDDTMQTTSSESGDDVTNTESTRYDEDDFATSDIDIDAGKNSSSSTKTRPPRIIVNIPVSKKESPAKDDSATTRITQKQLWTTKPERQALGELKRRGVMFESESEDDDYLSDEAEIHEHSEQIIDALHMLPRQSRNLFDIAPELDLKHVEQENVRQPSTCQPRPSRKEQWANLRNRKLQEQRQMFGDPHCEVNRRYAPAMVTAMIERVVSPEGFEKDTFAVESVQMKEEAITFGEFLGVPKSPKACLMSDGKRLAFRDGRNEMDRMLVRSSRGLVKRVTDEDKFPMRAR